MPINNALTPEGQNALGAAFGYYPQLRRNRQFNDPVASSEMPLQFMRSRFASTMGAIPDLMNLKRSLLPAEAVQALEAYGQIAPEVPYGSQYFQENLPLPPQGPAQQMAGTVGSFVPMSPMEALQAARLARQAALAGVSTGKKIEDLTVGNLQRAKIREMAKNVPEDTAYEPLRERLQATGNLAYAERVGNMKAVDALFPGKTEAMLSPAEKAALTKYKSILDTPAVMRREQARLFGTGDIVQPSLNVAQEIGVSPNALLNKYAVPILWDTSATGGNVTQIAGIPLTQGLRDATPAFVQRQGGRRYPYIQENLQQGIGGASNDVAQISKINNLNKFSDLGDTVGVQMNLAPTGINFSHHVAESYVGALNALKPSREALTSFRDAVRNTKVENPVTKEITYPYKKFPGLDSPNIRDIMANGTADYTAGNIRKAIGEIGSTAAMEKQGFPRWQDVYKVMSEPGAETGMAHTLLKVNPNIQMVTPNFKHGSYNSGLPAQVMGSLQNAQGQVTGVPDYLMMPKLFKERQAQGKTLSNIRTSLLKSHTGEKLDQEAIDNIARYLGYQVD
jgi:hypothetical protein